MACGKSFPHVDPQDAGGRGGCPDLKNRLLETNESSLLPPLSFLMDLLSGQKQRSQSQREQVVLAPIQGTFSPPVLQALISGLIPPPCVYSGRLKSSHPSLLSPNLQRNPLGLKPLPHGEARETGGWGRDWGRRLDKSSVLFKRIRVNNQSGQPSTHLTSLPSVDQSEHDFNLIDTNLI